MPPSAPPPPQADPMTHHANQRRPRIVVIPPDCAGAPLAATCAELLGEPVEALRAAVAAGRVAVGEGPCTDPDAPLRAGDRVRVDPPPRGGPAAAPEIEVLHRDRHLVVIRKPAGLPVQPTERGAGSAEAAILAATGQAPRLVHRLDLPVSGLLVAALSAGGATWLGRCFRERRIRKIYVARTDPAAGHRLPGDGEVADVSLALRWSGRERRSAPDPQGDPARTIFHGLGGPWVLADLLTGRTHQIRVHLASLGAPVAGDGLYAGDAAPYWRSERPRRIALHAAWLAFPAPDGGRLTFLDLPDRGATGPFAGAPAELEARILSLAEKRL